MKKIVSMLLVAAMCCGLLAGCGGSKVEMSDFDSATNQEKVIDGFSFEVPEKWKEGENTDELQYYYPEDGMLMIAFEETEEKLEDDRTREDFIKSFGTQMEKMKVISESEIEVDGNVAYHEVMSLGMDKKKFDSEMVVFNSDNGIICLLLSTLKESDKDYSNDFKKIIDSISKPLPFEKTIEDVNKLLTTLKAGGVCNFTATNFGDGTSTPMTTWIDAEHDLSIVAVGNRERYVTTIQVLANDEDNFVKVCTMALMGIDVLSPNASDFLTNLSSEELKNMPDGANGLKMEVIDGVSYVLQKDSNSAKIYSFMLKRDKETKDDYEKYLETR